jgi:hypothetical protein
MEGKKGITILHEIEMDVNEHTKIIEYIWNNDK